MDLDREGTVFNTASFPSIEYNVDVLIDSPATLRGDSPPLVYTIEDDAGPTIIDLETADELPGFSEGDFMTDAEFDATFSDSTRLIIDSFDANGTTYRRGQSVELQSGDFMRIVDILQDKRNQAIFIRGPRFRRMSRFPGLFDQHLNELLLLVEQNEPGPLNKEPLIQADADIVPSRNIVRLREIILTNEAYPAYSFKESRQSKCPSRAEVREKSRLVCRWKIAITYRMKTTHRACVHTSIETLRANESDRNYRARDEHLKKAFRGRTTEGGSCPGWLNGEKKFKYDKLKLNRSIDILGFLRQRYVVPSDTIQTRYTFGDAFCGAGGASSGAEGAGFRIDWGFDFDPAAIESYRQNFFATRCEAMPAHIFVTCIEESYIVDVLHLSPPCQTFSPAHTRTGQNDEMNSSSFFAVEELLKKTKPRVVTLENTFGLVERPGERLPDFPDPTHGPGRLPFATVNDAIARIPQGFANHEVEGAAKRNGAPYDADLPLRNCIMTGGSLDIHPSGERCFTDRELACLQSFALDHVFGKMGVKKQIGNAVPPLVALVFFGHIRRRLEEADR
ncbi:MAG: hypothetical protein Q9197_002946 [Variospora fuerteventurae]